MVVREGLEGSADGSNASVVEEKLEINTKIYTILGISTQFLEY